ncbi:SymE family type I addiction module toxin [Sodalis sp. RH19]|uniref:SymE family type I addiction module toxin n=1 Tax=unclassified Sodalis (in: enterobacteria) TaxID=2636512 RepID=UPI0039B36F6E
MAKRDCKSEPATTQVVKKEGYQPRHYTIGYAPNGGRKKPSPQLTIKGRWLEALGFNTGQSVTVTTEQGCLTIKTKLGV